MHWIAAEGDGTGPDVSIAAAILPFIIVIIFFLIAPLLTRKVTRVVRDQIERDLAIYIDAQTAVRQAEIRRSRPGVLSSRSLGDYLGYAADAVQVFPYTVLPIVGAAVA